MRIATFVISVLLLAGSVDPTEGWLVALAVVAGLSAAHWRAWRPFDLRPDLDLRLAAAVIAVLLAASVIEPTQGWLIALTVISGVALFAPRLISAGPRHRRWLRSYWRRGWGDDDFPFGGRRRARRDAWWEDAWR
jgi:hypothetical protein